MRKIPPLVIAFGIALLVGGCGGDDPDAIIKEKIAATDALVDALAKVQDRDSADIAAGAVKKYGERLHKQTKAIKKLPEAKVTEITQKYADEQARVDGRLSAEVTRLDRVDGGKELATEISRVTKAAAEQ